jgi:hypothetical protein
MIQVFKHCRPLLCVDGHFLTGQYRGTLPTTIEVDGNNQVVPIAFALVESENSESWLWFLKLLKQALIEGRENVCVLHDCNAGLLNVVQKLKNGTDLDVQWLDIQSRWCMRHLAANFYKQFKSKRLMDHFKRLCKQN